MHVGFLLDEAQLGGGPVGGEADGVEVVVSDLRDEEPPVSPGAPQASAAAAAMP